MLDISFIISCVWLQSINRGFTPHSCIIYNITYPFHNPTFSRSIPRTSTGYEPGFAHSFSNTFFLQLQLHPQRFSWFPRLPFSPRVLRSIFSFKRKLPCFNSFLSITVDKSCRHRMHLFHENYFISSFLHSLVLSLFPISVDEIASLLPCFHATERKSRTYAQEVITIFGIQISVQQVAPNGNWSLPASPTNLVYPKQYLRRGRHDDISRLEFNRRCWGNLISHDFKFGDI